MALDAADAMTTDDPILYLCPRCRSTVTLYPHEVETATVAHERPDPPPAPPITLTPYALTVLLHYYASAGPHEHERHFGTGTDGLFEETCQSFRQAGVLEPNPLAVYHATAHGRYRVTDRGEAYVRAILLTPVPDPYWQPTPNIWD